MVRLPKIPQLKGKSGKKAKSSGSDDAGSGSSDAPSALDKFVGSSKNRAGKAFKRASGATKSARDVGNHAYARGAALIEKGKNELQGAVQTVVDSVVDYALDHAGEVVKGAIKDPEMPNWVKSGVDSLVDEVWPDVKEETKAMVLRGIHTQAEIDHGEPLGWCPNPFAKMRALTLYHMMPYDKTIWGSLRDPIWWLFKVISAIPVYGIPQFFFFVLFMLQDKRDEFQLVSFIVRFKQMIFLSTGIVTALTASVQFYVCAVQSDNCHRHGPGEPIWLFIVFCLQIIFVWMAFLLLPCSEKKGVRPLVVRGAVMRRYDRDGDGMLDADEQRRYNRRRSDAKKKLALVGSASEGQESGSGSGSCSGSGTTWTSDDGETTWTSGSETETNTDYTSNETDSGEQAFEPSEHDPRECCCCTWNPNRGGRLRLMVFYDTTIFIISLLVMAVPMYVGPTKVDGDPLRDNWQFRATLLYAKIVYGLLSFPFIVFALPGCGMILTHSHKTAYNRNGRCVPFVKPRLSAEPDVESAKSVKKAMKGLGKGGSDD